MTSTARPTPFTFSTRPADQRSKRVRDTHITLAHGSGGQATRNLIDDIFVGSFDNPTLNQLEDQAVLGLEEMMQIGDRLAFTTDSFVVDPLFFPGSDIGALAVNGTVNDLAMGGATPLYLTCSVILEEGLPVETLRRVAMSMRDAAQTAGVQIVTGDTKVVPRGSADKLFINTAGVGVIRSDLALSAHRICPGDVVIVNGTLGDHGAAILAAREELALSTDIQSDCQPLNHLVKAMVKTCPGIRAMRDATRGGLATVLNEFAAASQVGIRLEESSIPVNPAVAGLCELLGLDPLYLANEGKLVAVVPAEAASDVLDAMHQHPVGQAACVVGEVISHPAGTVMMRTGFGTERVVDMLVGDQLPRIC
jgi:hydrogenase expression/formation protein HypE